jgi:stage IV sporulation protein FB
MLRFTIFGFPVLIHWMFWLNTALMGGALSASSPEAVQGLVAWVLAVLISILIHELGHAFAMRGCGDHSVGIVLYALGGVAKGSRYLTRAEDIKVTAAGPGLQIVFGLAAGWAMTLWPIRNAWVHELVDSFTVVSLFWAVLNLVPILPLDGGRLCAALLGNLRTALWISIVAAIILALWSLDHRSWLLLQNKVLDLLDIRAITRIGGGFFTLILFGFLAFNNFKQLQGEPSSPWLRPQ